MKTPAKIMSGPMQPASVLCSSCCFDMHRTDCEGDSHGWQSSMTVISDSHHSSQHPDTQTITRVDAPSRGRALVLAEFGKLCWHPSGYALYNRPITTKQVIN